MGSFLRGSVDGEGARAATRLCIRDRTRSTNTLVDKAGTATNFAVFLRRGEIGARYVCGGCVLHGGNANARAMRQITAKYDAIDTNTVEVQS